MYCITWCTLYTTAHSRRPSAHTHTHWYCHYFLFGPFQYKYVASVVDLCEVFALLNNFYEPWAHSSFSFPLICTFNMGRVFAAFAFLKVFGRKWRYMTIKIVTTNYKLIYKTELIHSTNSSQIKLVQCSIR